MSSSNCSSPSVLSIVFLAVGIVFFIVSLVLWVVFFLKRRRDQQKAHPKIAPRVDGHVVQASGEYVDIQDDDKYESMENPPGKTVKPATPYRPPPRNRKSQDAMEETFDGSRMPKTNAPKPPKHPPKSALSNVKNNDGLTESGNNIYEDYNHDEKDDKGVSGVFNKLKGRISRRLDSSYESPRSMSMRPTSMRPTSTNRTSELEKSKTLR